MKRILRVFDNYQKCRNDFLAMSAAYKKDRHTFLTDDRALTIVNETTQQTIVFMYLREHKDIDRVLVSEKFHNIVADPEAKFYFDHFIRLTSRIIQGD